MVIQKKIEFETKLFNEGSRTVRPEYTTSRIASTFVRHYFFSTSTNFFETCGKLVLVLRIFRLRSSNRYQNI